MGVGRRMQKQGPPEPLSEEHFSRLKRKAGIPVEPTSVLPDPKKRRFESRSRRANGAAATNGKRTQQTNGRRAQQTNGKHAQQPLKGPRPKSVSGTAAKGKGSKWVVSAEKFYSNDQNDDNGEEAGEGDEDMPALDDGEATMKDDFLESDAGSSVYDSDELQHALFSDDGDSSEAEEKLTAANIEGLSRKLDKELEEQAAEAQAEMEDTIMQTNIDGDSIKILQDDVQGDSGTQPNTVLLAPDLQVLRARITENIRVLESFSALAEAGRARSEYTNQLRKDICSYYGYSDYLAEKLLNLFPPREAFAFFEANESARPVVIRTNTLRINRRELAQALINRGVTLEPVGKWSKVGLQIFESNVPLGATPEYLAGQYMIQAASSFLPCIALDPQMNERVLDMAAAPGGKTTYLAAMMRNTGFILANDANKTRAKALVGNIHRLGARNVVVSSYDAREFPKPLGGFDRVLLDAPCSGTGVIAKDASVKSNRTEVDFMRLPHRQKQLLLAAIDSANHHSSSGGYIVYSTCSVAVEENEQVVQYALSRRPNVRIVEAGLPFGKPGFVNYMGKAFHPSMALARRFYPHTYNVDGFFVVKLKKIGAMPSAGGLGGEGDETAKNSNKNAGLTSSAKGDSKAANGREKASGKTDEGQQVAANDDDDFFGFDAEEDVVYMERARKRALKKRGINPSSVPKPKGTI